MINKMAPLIKDPKHFKGKAPNTSKNYSPLSKLSGCCPNSYQFNFN
jgi:hypothetical protein